MKDIKFKEDYSEACHRDRLYWNKKTGNARSRIRAFSQIVE